MLFSHTEIQMDEGRKSIAMQKVILDWQNTTTTTSTVVLEYIDVSHVEAWSMVKEKYSS